MAPEIDAGSRVVAPKEAQGLMDESGRASEDLRRDEEKGWGTESLNEMQPLGSVRNPIDRQRADDEEGGIVDIIRSITRLSLGRKICLACTLLTVIIISAVIGACTEGNCGQKPTIIVEVPTPTPAPPSASGAPSQTPAVTPQSHSGATKIVSELQEERAAAGGSGIAGADAMLSFSVVKVYNHDSEAFTQGLEYMSDSSTFVESTGLWGKSSIREVDITTGNVLKKRDLQPQFFGEGCTVFQGKIYQLTWRERVCLVYDRNTLAPADPPQLHYDTDGWGLTTDGQFLIMSDGSATLYFRHPITFAVSRKVSVHEVVGGDSHPVTQINELEMVRGEVWANIWHTDRIARIRKEDGFLLGWIDLTGINPRNYAGGDDVLNGIAWDKENDRLWVTGKTWARLFEIDLIRKG
uniref:Glutamine cyclotransferase n=1 Tax=Hemiselmis andersenii TaxID=464988 RepID=A0A6U4V680_HEMAN